MPSLVLFERDERVRRGLVELLSALPEIGPIQGTKSGEEWLALCQSGDWDIALFDMMAPGENTLNILERTRTSCPELPLVAISFVIEPPLIAMLRRLGIGSVVASEEIDAELAPAIRAILAGQTYFSQAVQQSLRDVPPQ